MLRYFIFVLVFGALAWSVLHIIQRQDAATAQWKRDAVIAGQGTATAHKATAAARAEVARVDTLYLPGRDRWRAVADSAIAHEKTNPEAASVARHADTVMVGDFVAIRARDNLIVKQGAELDSTQKELATWKRKPGAPRFQLYGEGLYDLLHSVPVVRAGLDIRIFGPLTLATAGEYAVQSPTMAGGFRVVTGVRMNF